MEPNKLADGRANFTATHWSVVVAAAGEDPVQARPALEILCKRYWLPVYAFLRGIGKPPEDAEDLTQSFFAQFIEEETVKKADPSRGKFWTFLLTSVKNYQVNEWQKQTAKKRGGGTTVVSIDAEDAEEFCNRNLICHETPELAYERAWAHTLINGSLRKLKEEYTASGKQDLFLKLEPGLTVGFDHGITSKLAEDLDMEQAAVRTSLSRLKKRYREILQSEIRDTIGEKGDVESELRALFAVLAGQAL